MNRPFALWTNAEAYLEYAEPVKGSIAAGKLADLVVLDENVMAVADHDLAKLTPVLTLAGGQVAFSSGVVPGDLL